MTELSPNTRRLLELARHQDDPAPGVQRRVERALSERLALGATAAGAAAASKTALAAKLLLPLGLAAVVAGGGWYSLAQSAHGPAEPARLTSALPRTPDRPPVPEPREPAAVSPAAPDAPAAGTPAAASSPDAAAITPAARRGGTARAAAKAARAGITPEHEPHAAVARDSAPHAAGPRTAPEGASSGEPAAVAAAPRETSPEAAAGEPAPVRVTEAARTLRGVPVDPLLAETEALRAAQRALRGGDTDEALELLNAQDRTYRSGALKEERAAARVLALCQGGDVRSARLEAERFVRRWPRSALRGRVLSACRAP
jgi:hypothetical protein